MKNKISAIKTRKNNVTSPQIPFVTTVQNIIYDNNYNVNDILGIIKINTEGNIKQQLDNLDNKINNASLHLTDEIKQQIMQAVYDAYPAAEDIRFITIYDENMVVQNGILIHQSDNFNITQNGNYDITTKSKINVNIQPSFQSKTTAENGLITPDEGYDGLSGVTVNVPIETHLQASKTVTTNGSVTPDSGYNGLLEVIVNVQPAFQNKTITKNGTYAPDEGYNGISSITINVRDDITTMPLTITQNGTYKASNENIDAFDEITVKVPNSYTADDENKVVQYGELTRQINRGTVRQNGTYDTSYNDTIEVDVDGSPAVLDTLTVTKNGFFLPKYGYDGFSSVVVNIPNGFTGDDNGKVVHNGALVKQTSRKVTENGTYDTTLNNELKVKVPGSAGSAKHDGTPNTADENKPGGVGSAVIGTDPTTGEQVIVGVDEDGNLVQTSVSSLPTAIKIINSPTKTSYIIGQTMDYSGILVAMKDSNGNTYTDANHPNGYLNMQQLIFPVDKAPVGSEGYSGTIAGFEIGSDGITIEPIVTAYFENGTTINGDFRWSYENGYGNLYYKNQQIHTSVCSTDLAYSPRRFYLSIENNVYYVLLAFPSSENPSILNSINPTVLGMPVDVLSNGNAIIPVQWTSPHTGNIYQDTFKITSNTPINEGGTS